MELHFLLKGLHDFSIIPKENPEITSIEIHSQSVKKGSLFICMKGEKVDGFDFISQAIDNGAVAIIAEQDFSTTVPVIKVKSTMRALAILANIFYQSPTEEIYLIGITGTNGKTSTALLIEQMLRYHGKSVGFIGTTGVKINDEQFSVGNTTPDALTLQKIFRQMREKNVETAVMEVSSHALQMGRVHGCNFRVAVFTNLTQDHLDFHGTMDKYKQAKSLLFSQLGNNYSRKQPKFAIFNHDDEVTEEMISVTQGIVITYGIYKESDIMAKDISISRTGTSFTLVVGQEMRKVETALIGMFNVYNTLAAISVAFALGISLDSIVNTMKKMSGGKGRFELLDEGQDFDVIIDYAHTPDSLKNALTTIRHFAKGKIYCIIGCGGNRDKEKRPIMAQIAEKLSDYPIFTSDNPRDEDPQAILQDMETGVTGTNYQIIVDRKTAIHYAIARAKTGDVVLIAGKGHETYQIIGDKVLDFDDRFITKKAILNRD